MHTSALNPLAPIPGRSFYLCLRDQYRFFVAERQMRFTPPVQTLFVLKQAVLETKLEGVPRRYARYTAAWETLVEGLDRLGLAMLVPRPLQSRLVTAIEEPTATGHTFEAMHDYTEAKSVWVNVDAKIPPWYPR